MQSSLSSRPLPQLVHDGPSVWHQLLAVIVTVGLLTCLPGLLQAASQLQFGAEPTSELVLFCLGIVEFGFLVRRRVGEILRARATDAWRLHDFVAIQPADDRPGHPVGYGTREGRALTGRRSLRR